MRTLYALADLGTWDQRTWEPEDLGPEDLGPEELGPEDGARGVGTGVGTDGGPILSGPLYLGWSHLWS